MKKVFIILLPLFLILFSCTEKPEKPKDEDKFVYSITLSPTSGSAYVNFDDTLTTEEVITLTVTVKRNNTLYTSPVQITFQTQGAYFVESLTNTYLAVTSQGKATATLFSNFEGIFEVSVFLKASDAANTPSIKGQYIFSVDPNLKVNSVYPTSGSTNGGEQVTIHGNGFVFPMDVYFGGQKAIYVSNTYSELVVQTPSHLSSCCGCNDVVDIKVVLNPGQPSEKSETLKNAYTYIFESSTPVITGIDPNHGTNNGGTLVSIYGNGFYCSEGVLVYFNDVPAKIIECKFDKIIVEAPPAYDIGITNCNQAVNIRVLNICGGLDATLDGAFKYGPEMIISSLSPNVGPSVGGSIVKIYGQGFDCPVAVSLGGVGAGVVSCSNNEIVVISGALRDPGCKDSEGDVVVTDIDCGISVRCARCWKYLTPKLNISYISPNQGAFPGTISIYGWGFYPPFEIMFAQSNALGYTYVDENTISSVGIPPFSGTYNTEDCTDSFGCEGKRNVNTPVDISVESFSTGCKDTFKSFFYIPPDTACHAKAPECKIDAKVSGCTITYTSATACGANYIWDYNGYSCTPAGNVLACTFTASGSYSVSVTITNSGGTDSCSGSGTIEAGANPACP